MSVVLEQCKSFIKIGVLPELIGKYYSKDPIVNNPDQENISEIAENELWCYCQQPEGDEEMIACDDNTSHSVVSCILRIKKIPKSKWFCPDCRKCKSKLKK